MSAADRELYVQGRASFERGEVERALQTLGALLERKLGFADLHYMVGVLLDRQGDADGARDRLRDAVRLNPAYTEALLALASVYERDGDYARSRELTERAAQAAPAVPGALDATTRGKLANLQAAVGDAYADVGEYREAIDAYRRALDRCPDFHDIRHRLGVALRAAGLPARAELEFKRVLRGNPDLLGAQVQLGLTYYTMGRAPDAVAVWSEVLRRDPSQRDALMYLRLVRGAEAERSETPERTAGRAQESQSRPQGFLSDDPSEDLSDGSVLLDEI
jgi:tetratricopeptide (TPR) repeat protein